MGFDFFYRSIRYICRLTVFYRSVCFPRSRARNLSTRLLVAHCMGYADICCHLNFSAQLSSSGLFEGFVSCVGLERDL